MANLEISNQFQILSAPKKRKVVSANRAARLRKRAQSFFTRCKAAKRATLSLNALAAAYILVERIESRINKSIFQFRKVMLNDPYFIDVWFKNRGIPFPEVKKISWSHFWFEWRKWGNKKGSPIPKGSRSISRQEVLTCAGKNLSVQIGHCKTVSSNIASTTSQKVYRFVYEERKGELVKVQNLDEVRFVDKTKATPIVTIISPGDWRKKSDDELMRILEEVSTRKVRVGDEKEAIARQFRHALEWTKNAGHSKYTESDFSPMGAHQFLKKHPQFDRFSLVTGGSTKAKPCDANELAQMQKEHIYTSYFRNDAEGRFKAESKWKSDQIQQTKYFSDELRYRVRWVKEEQGELRHGLDAFRRSNHSTIKDVRYALHAQGDFESISRENRMGYNGVAKKYQAAYESNESWAGVFSGENWGHLFRQEGFEHRQGEEIARCLLKRPVTWKEADGVKQMKMEVYHQRGTADKNWWTEQRLPNDQYHKEHPSKKKPETNQFFDLRRWFSEEPDVDTTNILGTVEKNPGPICGLPCSNGCSDVCSFDPRKPIKPANKKSPRVAGNPYEAAKAAKAKEDRNLKRLNTHGLYCLCCECRKMKFEFAKHPKAVPSSKGKDKHPTSSPKDVNKIIQRLSVLSENGQEAEVGSSSERVDIGGSNNVNRENNTAGNAQPDITITSSIPTLSPCIDAAEFIPISQLEAELGDALNLIDMLKERNGSLLQEIEDVEVALERERRQPKFQPVDKIVIKEVEKVIEVVPEVIAMALEQQKQVIARLKERESNRGSAADYESLQAAYEGMKKQRDEISARARIDAANNLSRLTELEILCEERGSKLTNREAVLHQQLADIKNLRQLELKDMLSMKEKLKLEQLEKQEAERILREGFQRELEEARTIRQEALEDERRKWQVDSQQQHEERMLTAKLDSEMRQQQFTLKLQEEMNDRREKFAIDMQAKNKELDLQRQILSVKASGIPMQAHRVKFIGGIEKFTDGTQIQVLSVQNFSKDRQNQLNTILNSAVGKSAGRSWNASVGGGFFVNVAAGTGGSWNESYREGFDHNQIDIVKKMMTSNMQAVETYTVRSHSGVKFCSWGGLSNATLTWDQARTLSDSESQFFSFGEEVYFVESVHFAAVKVKDQQIVALGGSLDYKPQPILVQFANLATLANSVQVLSLNQLEENITNLQNEDMQRQRLITQAQTLAKNEREAVRRIETKMKQNEERFIAERSALMGKVTDFESRWKLITAGSSRVGQIVQKAKSITNLNKQFWNQLPSEITMYFDALQPFLDNIQRQSVSDLNLVKQNFAREKNQCKQMTKDVIYDISLGNKNNVRHWNLLDQNDQKRVMKVIDTMNSFNDAKTAVRSIEAAPKHITVKKRNGNTMLSVHVTPCDVSNDHHTYWAQ